MRHSTLGLIDTSDLLFVVHTNVTSFEPQTGSLYGGTLVTITGSNFGTVPTDNPVQLSTWGGVHSIDCYVETIEATQITCRVDDTDHDGTALEKDPSTEATLIVFLGTSEEAFCMFDTDGDDETAPSCTYTYDYPSAHLLTRQLVFDNEALQWQLIVTGYGFEFSEAPALYVGDAMQELVYNCASKVIFAITDVQSSTLSDMRIYFDEGIPEGHSIITESEDLVMHPEVVSISPSKGSIGGTKVEVTVPGIAPDSEVDVVDDAGESVCDSVTVPQYGKVECMTKPEVIVSELFVKVGDDTYGWYSRGYASDSAAECPEVAETYTYDYWFNYYTGENSRFGV
jgi:hypothetical protein